MDSSDSGSLQSSLNRKGSDSSGSVSSLGTKGKSKSYRSNPSLTSAGVLRKSVSDSVGDVAQLQTSKYVNLRFLKRGTFSGFNDQVLLCHFRNGGLLWGKY